MIQIEGIQIPDTVTANSEDNITWAVPLFKKIAEQRTTSNAIWNYIFNTLFFFNEDLTDAHKYAICIIFSALITRYALEERLASVGNQFEDVINEVAKEINSMRNRA